MVGTRIIAGEFASRQRTGGVDQAGEVVDRGVLVVPENISRVAKLSLKLALKIGGDSKQSQCGNEALVGGGVKRPETNVADLTLSDVETVSNSLWQVVEDLASTVVGRHEWVVERPLEAHLSHEAVGGIFSGHAFRGSNHLGQRRGDSAGGWGRRGIGSGLSNDARANKHAGSAVGSSWLLRLDWSGLAGDDLSLGGRSRSRRRSGLVATCRKHKRRGLRERGVSRAGWDNGCTARCRAFGSGYAARLNGSRSHGGSRRNT